MSVALRHWSVAVEHEVLAREARRLEDERVERLGETLARVVRDALRGGGVRGVLHAAKRRGGHVVGPGEIRAERLLAHEAGGARLGRALAHEIVDGPHELVARDRARDSLRRDDSQVGRPGPVGASSPGQVTGADDIRAAVTSSGTR